MTKKFGLKPVLDKNTKILILGSLPSDISIEKQEYYANKINDFWRILSSVFDIDLINLNYVDKIIFLKLNSIGLWDIFETSIREGSMDKDMKENILNNFNNILDICPKLEKIIFNGALSFKSSNKLEFLNVELIHLPSSSGANRRNNVERFETWKNKLN
jgi:TDG/mug DNA glycosylase family protein